MFEETEVCIQCGRPVDGRVYCSDECESLDGASPSLSSATSSAHPSPYVTSMKSSNLDVPALVPSTLGHRARYSISSSASSTAWSAVTTDEEDPYLSAEHVDMISDGSKSPGLQSGLCYARRPSTTNHRSIVPMLHRHSSVVSSSASASSYGMSRGLPSPFYASTEDDASSVCISELSLHEDDASARRKAKRTSLPAYFSLLQGSSVSSSAAASSPRRTPSALHVLSRSLHASPTTPKVSHATVVLTNAEAHIESTTTTTTSPVTRGRGRRREREPDARSSSSRRSTARSPPRHLSAAQRARLDSVEKVVEWVSSSPVVAFATGRRNSSPQRKPKYEFVEALTRGLRGCAVASSSDEDEDATGDEKKADFSKEDMERTIRGRRRADELDEALSTDAPGYGSGRSGLKARERGRGLTSRAIGIALR